MWLSNLWLNFKCQFLKWFARVACRCWLLLLVAVAVFVELVLVELFEVMAVEARYVYVQVLLKQVDEVYFKVAVLVYFVQVYLVNFVQVLLDVPLVLWLLEGCRVRVAVRAPPLQ